MGLLIDDRNNKRLVRFTNFEVMPMSGDVQVTIAKGTRHRTMDQAIAPRVTFDVAVIYDSEENLGSTM